MILSMRPIHRPVHDLAVLPEVWDKMTSDEQAKARAQGKIRVPVRQAKLSPSSNLVSPPRAKRNFSL